jgi:hypothetical protein
MAGGIRLKVANIDFDVGTTYFDHPGERLSGETRGHQLLGGGYPRR